MNVRNRLRKLFERFTGKLFERFTGKKQTTEAEARAPHLSYQRLQSSVAGVRFLPQAIAAARRRALRSSVRAGLRLNTRGLPFGSRRSALRLCDIRRLPLIKRYDRATKEWTPGQSTRGQTAQTALLVRETVKSARPSRLSKAARSVSAGKRLSCSAMRSMAEIFIRQEDKGRGTKLLAIKQTAQSIRPEPPADASRQQKRGEMFFAAQYNVTAAYPHLPRKVRRKIARSAVAQAMVAARMQNQPAAAEERKQTK